MRPLEGFPGTGTSLGREKIWGDGRLRLVKSGIGYDATKDECEGD